MDSTDFDTENFSVSSLIDLFLLIPAVSIKVISFEFAFRGTSIESLVVPDSGETSTLTSPNNWLTKVDFPAIGLPIIEIFNESVEIEDSIASSESSKSFNVDLISERPILCAAETLIDSVKPSLSNSVE